MSAIGIFRRSGGKQTVFSRSLRNYGSRMFSSSSGPEVLKEVPKASSGTKGSPNMSAIFAVTSGLGVGVAAWKLGFLEGDAAESGVTEAHLINWSGTHEVTPKQLLQPESLEELEAAVTAAHLDGRKLRAVGSALSPNGLSFCDDSMISMALMDKILDVDAKTGLVTVQAGARVQDVVEALRPANLTLQNYASIREQQIGGFTQVGAHGTGAAVPPVDEQVVSMKIVTPGEGTIELSPTSNPELFHMVKCGLGCFGVVAEVTLQCIPAHRLIEKTWTCTMADIRKNHSRWLKQNQHIRYMWIPYTDTVVVVSNNPIKAGLSKWLPSWLGFGSESVQPAGSDDEKLSSMRTLLEESKAEKLPDNELASMTMSQLRDALVAISPLDAEWIAKVNKAEAEFWKLNSGTKEGWSDEMLGFDCGGQQWVLEMAFPTGTVDKPTFADLAYMEQLLAQIENDKIPAPSPIEQRWTSASASPMSPAFSSDPKSVFSWVGVIMYLPEDNAKQREEITARFRDYTSMLYTYLVPQYGAVEHWAKIEVPSDADQLDAFRKRLKAKYPTDDFIAARRQLDPKNIMSNKILDDLFPLSPPS